MPATLDFTPGSFRSSLKSSIEEINALGPIPDRVDDYLRTRGDVDPSVFGGDVGRLKSRMAHYLKGRGVKLDDNDRFKFGGYDEILFTAYDRSLSALQGDGDPLISVNRGEEVTEWDFKVDWFENEIEQGIDRQSILAAGAIDYVYELGERMGVFRLAEALVLNWAAGKIDVSDNRATTRLYGYWKQLDDRSDEDERGMLYRRVLGRGETQLLSRMVANDGFPVLWQNLMGEIATFIEKSERLESGLSDASSVSPGPIQQTMREIQYNLTEHCTGMAFVQAQEMYKQLQSAFQILGDPDIVANFGGPRRRNMWKVISELSRDDFGVSTPIGPLLRVAVDGNRIFRLIAEFNTSLSLDQNALRQLLEAGESYIINSSVVEGQLNGRADDRGRSEEETDMEEDGFSDDAFEDDFAAE